MVDNYYKSSSKLFLTKEQLKKVGKIIDRVVADTVEEEDYFGVEVTFQPDGLWMHGDDNFIPDHAARLAQTIIDELEIDEPFLFSWSYTCNKSRLNEFGGGACVISRKAEPYILDAQSLAEHYVLKLKRDGNGTTYII